MLAISKNVFSNFVNIGNGYVSDVYISVHDKPGEGGLICFAPELFGCLLLC